MSRRPVLLLFFPTSLSEPAMLLVLQPAVWNSFLSSSFSQRFAWKCSSMWLEQRVKTVRSEQASVILYIIMFPHLIFNTFEEDHFLKWTKKKVAQYLLQPVLPCRKIWTPVWLLLHCFPAGNETLCASDILSLRDLHKDTSGTPWEMLK